MKTTYRINEVTDSIINSLDPKIISTLRRSKDVHNFFYLSNDGFEYDFAYELRTMTIKIISGNLIYDNVKFETILVADIESIIISEIGDNFKIDVRIITDISEYKNFMIYYRDFKLKTLLNE